MLALEEASKGPSIISLNIDEEICFDNTRVADRFNEFFTSVASELVAKLPYKSNRATETK